MTESITLRDANQNFAKYIKAVEDGREFVITRRGEPVAKLSPVSTRRKLTPAQQAARRRSLERLREGWDLGIERIDRDALHER